MRVAVQDRHVVVSVEGDLDQDNAAVLSQSLTGLGEVHCLVLDLGGVDFVDAEGLAVILAQSARMRAHGHELVIRSPSPATFRLLASAGFVDVVASGGGGLDVERWIELCRHDVLGAASRPDGLDDDILGEILSAVAYPAASAHQVIGEVDRLAALVDQRAPDRETALSYLVWAAEVFTRVVTSDLSVEQRAEVWTGLGEIVPKTMARVAAPERASQGPATISRINRSVGVGRSSTGR